MSEPLQRLAQALDVERQALVEHDVHALIRATGAKLEALRALEGAPPLGKASSCNWPNATAPTAFFCRAGAARSTGPCASSGAPKMPRPTMPRGRRTPSQRAAHAVA